ncbi:MAG: hypothetical protein N2505_00130 [Endomicrobia bacterium]|nr:hypothetical protein [Endomicrobiia bacterium]
MTLNEIFNELLKIGKFYKVLYFQDYNIISKAIDYINEERELRLLLYHLKLWYEKDRLSMSKEEYKRIRKKITKKLETKLVHFG